MLIFDDIKVEFESQGFKGIYLYTHAVQQANVKAINIIADLLGEISE